MQFIRLKLYSGIILQDVVKHRNNIIFRYNHKQ
jgi:hypothetical protein